MLEVRIPNCLQNFRLIRPTRSRVTIGMSLKPCFQRTPTLAPPCRDLTVTRRLSTIISNFSTSLLQCTLQFSISINAHTNSFGEEVIDLHLDPCCVLRIDYSMASYISLSLEGLRGSIRRHYSFSKETARFCRSRGCFF